MLKRNITYKDFDGVEHTDEFYFNLTKTELVELEADSDGLGELLGKLIASQNKGAIFAKFKEIIVKSYGEKSEDGKRFVKRDGALGAEFAESAAYDALFIELTSNENLMMEFIEGIMPEDLLRAVKAQKVQDKPTGLPAIGPRPPKPPKR